MTAIIVWGKPDLHETPDHQHIWGRAFEILPSGTMLGADEILRGVIGRVVALAGTNAKATILLCGTGLTATEELLPFRQQLADELLLPISG
jgi:hypothetical protein